MCGRGRGKGTGSATGATSATAIAPPNASKTSNPMIRSLIAALFATKPGFMRIFLS
jgi:hypothetical protein